MKRAPVIPADIRHLLPVEQNFSRCELKAQVAIWKSWALAGWLAFGFVVVIFGLVIAVTF